MRNSKWILWACFLLTIPVPYFMVEVGWVPTLRLLAVAGLTLAAVVMEPSNIGGLIAALFAVQAAFYAGALYLVAVLVSRLLHRRAAPRTQRAVVLAIVFVLLAASLLDIYTTPLSRVSAHGNLLTMFE